MLQAPDCCASPLLGERHTLKDALHDEEHVFRCQHCGRHWLQVSWEFVDFDDGNDFWVDTYAPLTPEEAVQRRIDAGLDPDAPSTSPVVLAFGPQA